MFRATDGSALLDLDAEEVKAQVEWGGIVEADELLFRLRHPRIGRIEKPQGGLDNHAGVANLVHDDVPGVSILSDVVISRKFGGDVVDAESVAEVMGFTDDLARDVSESLAGGEFVKEMGVDQ